MKVRYECEFCKEQFDNEMSCKTHEASHLTYTEKTKYLLRHVLHESVCAHCANAFYVL